MKIVDICAFYTPRGGGVRTYIRQKLEIGPRLGHEIVILAPGRKYDVEIVGPQARIVTIPGPAMPFDPRYHYFKSADEIHSFLDTEQPDFVEASSPWRTASAVADWKTEVPRSLIMHADPLSAYAYRWLGGIFPRPSIDRQFEWFWRYLRRLDNQYDVTISASKNLTARLRAGGLNGVCTIPMGIDAGVYSPQLRDEQLRRHLLYRCGLGPDAMLLLGIGRHAPEKRWPMVVEAATAAGNRQSIGLIILGEGRDTDRIQRTINSNPHIQLFAPNRNPHEFAKLVASCDALVHGSEAETFCMVGAEARASGLPIIAPDLGALADQCEFGSGELYLSANALSLAAKISKVGHSFPEYRQKAIDRAHNVGTMDDHFVSLFESYEQREKRRVA